MYAFNRLVEYIEEYESDTFSASGHNITHDEAVRVANRLIESWTDRLLDGVSIADAMTDDLPKGIL
jgi:hypothetical protein